MEKRCSLNRVCGVGESRDIVRWAVEAPLTPGAATKRHLSCRVVVLVCVGGGSGLSCGVGGRPASVGHSVWIRRRLLFLFLHLPVVRQQGLVQRGRPTASLALQSISPMARHLFRRKLRWSKGAERDTPVRGSPAREATLLRTWRHLRLSDLVLVSHMACTSEQDVDFVGRCFEPIW